MRLLGAHMSIAGGVDKAIKRGQDLGCTAIQIFVKNNNRWFGPPLTEEEIERFFSLKKKSGIFVFAHAGYLINLSNPHPGNYQKSLDSTRNELERCESLNLPFLVLHPGSAIGQTEEAGISRVVKSLDYLLKATPGYQVKIALETTAGQGSNLGYKFEHFVKWLDQVKESNRLAVCFDTCHSFAAGYDLKSASGYDKCWEDFAKQIGFDKLAAFHLNDSKKDLGSRTDRHENIGQGSLGEESFIRLLNDSRFINLPMVLETPKDPDGILDRQNLARLNSFISTQSTN